MASQVKAPNSMTSSRIGRNGSVRDSDSPDKLKSKHSQEPLKRFICDDRDYRSHAVSEFDAHQEDARKTREEKLKKVVNKRY
jgi:hypothetical protein